MPFQPLNLPSAEILRATFALTEDGRLINRIARTSRKFGEYADGHFRGRYRTVYVAGRLRAAHRVIWKMAHGFDPMFLDHINGNPSDNRLDNLREATHAENMKNKKLYRSNTSGVKGVHRRKDTGHWRAYVSEGGRRKWLGQFPTIEQAKKAAERTTP